MFKTVSAGAVALALAAAMAGTALTAAPQESKSAPLAKQLAQLLDASKLETIAAADPSRQGFVAAFYIPGTQLLVVSGKFQTPEMGIYRLEKKEYRELYMDLMGGAVPGSRLVASDVKCDGLSFKPQRDAPADTWENGSTTHAFEGAKKAKLSDEVYARAYEEADTQYARILEILLAQAKPKGGGS
jgi:hypothetical protein